VAKAATNSSRSSPTDSSTNTTRRALGTMRRHPSQAPWRRRQRAGFAQRARRRAWATFRWPNCPPRPWSPIGCRSPAGND
jgi:hypothetical protein